MYLCTTWDALFEYFWASISKNCCYVWNQCSQICRNLKFFVNKKFFKLPQLAALGLQFKKLWILESRSFIRNKKSLNFGLKMTFLVSFRSELQVKLLPYLKSAPSNFPACKVMLNKKTLKLGTKIALFRYFWAGIWKTHCHVWNRLLQIYQKYIFNQYSELWHRFHFF